MELLLKNVSEEHLALLSELAKSLHFQVSEPIEDEAHYLKMMEETKFDEILSEKESKSFIDSLRKS
jgi:hypothetical protein